MRTFLYVMALLAPVLTGCATSPQTPAPAQDSTPAQSVLDERIAFYAEAYAIPESLIRRSIQRESGYNPKAHAGPYWGLMQIRLDTARGMGYRGTARGLLDADTNLKYAVAYLSNAYVVSGGNADRAMALYASGYFYEARRKGLLDQLRVAETD